MKTYSQLSRQQRIKKVMDNRRTDIVLVLENLSEDLNISAILRTAEAFGVGGVRIVHPASPVGRAGRPSGVRPKLSKHASSGAVKWLEIKFYTSISLCLNLLKKRGFEIVGALVDPEAEVLWQTKFSGKVAIVVGNEAKGLSPKAIAKVDKKVYLPMFGLTESLNVSAAAAIFLYEVIRQKESTSGTI